MRRKRLTIVSCSVFGPELMALSRSGRLSYPMRFADSAFHMKPDAINSYLNRVVHEERSDGRSVVLVYGDCSSAMHELSSKEGVFRVKGNNCGIILLGKARYKQLMREGAFLLFPEWADRWKRILVNFPGMDQSLSSIMMQEMHKKFVYLNTGQRPVPYEHIKACSEFFGIPYEILDVDLKNLETAICDAIELVPDEEDEQLSPVVSLSSQDKSSTALMLLDITASVLMSLDDTQVVLLSLSQKLRELTGAKTSALIALEERTSNNNDEEESYKVLAVTPPRRACMLNEPSAKLLIKTALLATQAEVLRAPDCDAADAVKQLYPCLVLPLCSGIKHIGVSLSFGLIDEAFVSLITQIQDVLSNVVGVIVNNALLREKQNDIMTELQQERQRLAYVLEGTNVGAWELNCRTGDVIANEQDAKLLGYAYKPVYKLEEWEKKIHPDDMQMRNQVLNQHLKGEIDIFCSEYRRQRDDGTWMWVLARGKVLSWGKDGSPLVIYGTHMDVTESKTTVEQAVFLANHDALTGLPNIRLAKERLSKALIDAEQNATRVAVFFIDIDGFKYINDNYGHDMGDKVLQIVASRMKGCVRDTDTVARIGGDEFLVLLTKLQSYHKAALVASRIMIALGQPIIPDGTQSNNEPINVRASTGISIFPDHAKDMEALVNLADDAMYMVKNSGKNNYIFASKQRESE